MTDPWFKFYPTDWRAEPKLRICSLAARGLWIELIGYMHEAEPYGHLTIAGVQPDINGIASLVGRSLKEVRKAFAELEACQVFSRHEDGAIVSRRMVRDKAKAKTDHKNGTLGGNPKLSDGDKGGVNPPDNPEDKAQKPDTRSQIPDTSLRSVLAPQRRKAERLPDDWLPDEEGRGFANKQGLSDQDLRDEIEKFRNHWHAKGGKDAAKMDWSATWRNWALNWKTWMKDRNGTGAGHNRERRGADAVAAGVRAALAERPESRFYDRGDGGAVPVCEDGDDHPGEPRTIEGGSLVDRAQDRRPDAAAGANGPGLFDREGG